MRSSGLRRAAAAVPAVFAISASNGVAQPAPDEWASRASPAEIADAVPALRGRKDFFRGVMRCAVENSGELSNCRVIQETPLGLGIGPGLLSLAPKYRRKPPGEKGLREVNIAESWAPADKPADWSRRPTANDLRSVFPVEAYKRGISGSATIECVATLQGALTNCVSLEETPADKGFGGAAIALTPQFMMKPAMRDGAPALAIVRIPINFRTFGPAPMSEGKRVMPTNLAWAEAPTYADVVEAYPKKAREARVGGRATVGCTMTREGRLANCEVISSDPRQYGFDTAAKALAKRFRLEVATPKDAATTRDLMVHLPVTFDPMMLDQKEPVVGKPNWAALPSTDEVVAAFQALKATTTVRVQLTCVVQPAGYVSQCVTTSEQPVGIGAGAAALSLAPGFRLSTWSTEGLPVVGGTVRIPIRYEPDAPAKASPPAAGH